MKKLMRLALVGLCLAVAALIAAGCASGKGDAFEVTDGGYARFSDKRLEVQLEADVAGGYQWECEADGATVKFVEGVAGDYLSGKAPEGEGVGLAIFTYEPEGSGETVLTFTYARPGEAPENDKTFSLVATVEAGMFRDVKMA
ncbi:protease inhibitor I42 family protein [Arabiibacter massiliensis]|uniref:protease inhibitor I42 family protein n=1 Tax=Arabiibacter massiliensis TaxID=1870985 RepID=UPI00155B0C3A|nr:protease inhibitor I42 family protein [Arabiibacter massiliensis]